MVRFDRKRPSSSVKRPPDYQSRAVQQRLLAMVGILLLVVIMMQHAGRPETWAWMFGTSAEPVPAVDTAAPDPPSLVARPAAAGTTLAGPSDETGWLPSLDRTLLDSIADDRYFRREENAAWFHLFAQLRESTNEQLNQVSLGPVSYLQLYRQTNAYRGRVVSLEGTLRRAHRLTAADNDVGLQSYWQCWLFPRNSRNPVVVYALNVPADFEESMTMALPIRCDGIVYKRWPYESTEQLTVAPVVLAKTIAPLSEAPLKLAPDWAAPQRQQWPMVFALTGAAAVVLVIGLYRLTARSTADKLRQRHEGKIVIEIPPDTSEPTA